MAITDRSRLSFPPMPLEDKDLSQLAESARIHAVWVPTQRPRSVTTTNGKRYHGDIIHFWIELDNRCHYALYSPPSSGGKWCWYRKRVEIKDDIIGELNAGYHPLVEAEYGE